MKCLIENLEVNYPCSPVCHLYGDCMATFLEAKKQHVRTNADLIRAMSDEELAVFLERVHNFPCETCCDNLYWCRRNNAMEPVCRNHFMNWLQQPAEED